MRPLTGRELNEQHKALTEAGVSRAFILAWLERETALWLPASPSPSTQEAKK